MSFRRRVVACVLVAGALGVVPEIDSRAEAGAQAVTASPLDAIRDELDALRFERALTLIEDLLAGASVPDETRIEALELRAQAHVATGDLDRAEEDYRQILAGRPAYAPDPRLTPKKALARFDKARAATVGTARLAIDPKDARITIDGKEVSLSEDGTLYLVTGERLLRAERRGFDALEVRLQVTAGQNPPIEARLVPNARTLVVRTDPDGVAVRLDDRAVGATIRPAGSSGPAEIAIEEVPLGEHVFELTKPCFRTTRVRAIVTVDLEVRSPLVLEMVTLESARSRLVLEGASGLEAEVRIDGVAAARLPAESVDVCAGSRSVEVLVAGRTLWASQLTIAEGEETRVRISPRPNAVIVGAEAWPRELQPIAESFTTLATLKLPADSDLGSAREWDRIALPPATDLALAVLPPAERAGDDRVYLYSPVLRRVYRVIGAIPEPTRPAWRRNAIGVRLADSSLGGPARIVDVIQGSPAAAAGIVRGERLSQVAGSVVDSSRSATERIESQTPGAPFPLEVVSSSGVSRTVSVTGAASPIIVGGDPEVLGSAILAAWASVFAVASPEDAPAALANLALLLSSAGQHARALELWQRVRFHERAGIGEGTVSYYLGRELAILGRENEAREAFSRARESRSTALTDEGPEIGPAASDHLVDLGVSRP